MIAEDDGYATPAAAVICLAIAAVVTAVTARSMSELHLAKAELSRTQADYAGAAALDVAIIAIATSDQPPPYHWAEASLGQAYDVVAEPERAKLSPSAMASLDDSVFAGLGVTNSTPVRAKLAGLTQTVQLIWISDQADTALWRACANSFASPYGAATSLQTPVYSAPHAGAQAATFRAGEVWRIVATDPAGWRDERIVRFTGNGLDPAAVIGRRFSRATKGQPSCEDLLSASSAA